MNFSRISLVFLVIFAGFSASFCLAKPFYSADGGPSNYFGENFAQLDSRKSLEDLWQAMLREPYDPELEEYLQEFLEKWTLDAVDRVRVLAVRDDLKQARNLSRRRLYYSDKNEELKRMILREGVSRDNLEMYLRQMGEDSGSVSSPEMPVYFLQDGTSWGRLQKLLNEGRMSLEEDVFQLERQYQGLTRLQQHKTAPRIPSVSTVIVMTGQGASEANAADSGDGPLISLMSSDVSRENLESFPEVIADLQHQIAVLRQDLLQKDDKMEAMRAQVIDMNLNLAQRDKVLNDRINELVDIRKRMDDVQARFDLGQKIIREKDIQIESVKNELAYVKKEMTDQLHEKDRQIGEMAGMLDVYWKRLNAVTERADKKDRDVSFLMRRLLSLQERLEEREDLLLKTHHDLDDFEGRLQDARHQIDVFPQMASEPADRDLLELENKLENLKTHLTHQFEENDALSRYLAEQQDASLQPRLYP